MIIALPAIALTLTYGILKFPNFAIGAMLTTGAYFAFIGNAWLHLPLLWAAVLAAGALALTNVAVDRLVFQPLRERTAITLLVASMGVSFVLENIARFVFGNSARSFEVRDRAAAAHFRPAHQRRADLHRRHRPRRR